VVQRAAEIAKEEFTVGIIQCYRTGKTGIDPHRDKVRTHAAHASAAARFPPFIGCPSSPDA
jgi:hypothetical protein